MTTPIYDDLILAALDFPTPAVRCQFERDECTAPAEWDVVTAVVSRGRILGTVHDLLCTAHRDTLVDHFATCPDCPQYMRIERVVGL